MNIQDFIKLTDQKKLILNEIKVSRELQEESWTAISSGGIGAYVLDGVFLDGEVVEVKVNGESLEEVFTAADCDSTTGSFYYDDYNQLLYIHTPDDDDPETQFSDLSYKYCITAFFWVGICNRHDPQESTVNQYDEDVLQDGGLEEWASATDLVYWTETIVGGSTINRENGTIYEGAYSARFDIDAADNNARLDAYCYLTPGRQARLRITYKNSAVGKTAAWRLRDTGANVHLQADGQWVAAATWNVLPNATDWTVFELSFYVHGGYLGYELSLKRDVAASSSIYFDDISIKHLKESRGTFAIYEREEEILQDGRCEFWASATDLKYWGEVTLGGSTINRETDENEVYEGGACVRLDVDGVNSNVYIYQGFVLPPRRKARLRLRYKFSAPDQSARIWVKDTSNTVYLKPDGTWNVGWNQINLFGSTEWQTYELEFITHEDYTEYQIQVARRQTSGESVYFDDISIKRIRQPLYYRPFLYDASIPSIYQGVGDYYSADERISLGTISYINDGWFYEKKDTYLWHNKVFNMRIGAVGSDYDELFLAFVGITRKPDYQDDQVLFDIQDTRLASLKKIPQERYDTTTYPNLDPDLNDTAIPILLGEKQNIIPGLIDTVARTYKISQTIWGGVTYALESIVSVEADGATLTGGGVDYAADLNNGEFTLNIDPGDALITCHAKGIKCDFEDGTYSENVADFSYFALVVLNGVDELELEIARFLDLKSERTQKLAEYINAEVETLDLFRKFKRSAIYHLFPLLNGQFTAKRYVAGIDDETIRFRNEDYYEFQLREETDQAFKTVVIKYDINPTTQEWKEKSGSVDKAEYKHDVKTTLEVETSLRVESEAETLLTFYLRLIKDPADKIIAKVTDRAVLLNPTDKGIFTRTAEYDSGEVTVFNERVYRILELEKDASNATVGIVGIRDIQAVGYSSHADVPHEDFHADETVDEHYDTHGDAAYTDDHDDVPWSDTHYNILHSDWIDYVHTDSWFDDPYEDWYLDSHGDTPHGNAHTDLHVDHGDNQHDDAPHEDIPHSDSYVDLYLDHADGGHIDKYSDNHSDGLHHNYPYQDHSDYIYDNVAYTDVPHIDTPHSNMAHTDKHGDTHGDWTDDGGYRDVPHGNQYTDIEHEDQHYDGGHSDSHADEYSDSHLDDYDDVEHVDSYIE